MARIPFPFSLFSRSREEQGDPVSGAFLAAIRDHRGGGEKSLPEPPAWFATSVVARLRREEAAQAERHLRRQYWARVLIPSGLAALFLLFLGIGEHRKTVLEEDQVTFAALDAIANAKGETGQAAGGDGAPHIVEGVSWSAP